MSPLAPAALSIIDRLLTMTATDDWAFVSGLSFNTFETTLCLKKPDLYDYFTNSQHLLIVFDREKLCSVFS